MKKIILLLIVLPLFAGCSKSLIGTEWDDESVDVTIIFISDSQATMKFDNEGIIAPIAYKYSHPDITLIAPPEADMVGTIDGNKMTFKKYDITFIKKER